MLSHYTYYLLSYYPATTDYGSGLCRCDDYLVTTMCVCCVHVQPHVCTRCEGQYLSFAYDLTLRAPTFVHAFKYFVTHVVSGESHVRCVCRVRVAL